MLTYSDAILGTIAAAVIILGLFALCHWLGERCK